MTETFSFGEWVSQRRKALDMTQRDLAEHANCTVATVKKIESDERRPSRDLAGLLAEALRVPPDRRETFIECARGLRPIDALAQMEEKHASPSSVATPNLPAPSTPFIGREAELAQLERYLHDPACRLLTLVGPGGIGKTRLAIEVARLLFDKFSDGVAFVPLAALTDAALIPAAIAHTLRLTLSDSPEVQLMGYLRLKRMLIVLDNCEQLGDGVAWLSDLLAPAPGVKLLATSRERLQLAEEWVFTVPELADTQAVELFDQTSRRTQPGFDLVGQQTTVSEICKLVENLPLAIELAAGWTPFLSCAQIAEHIQQDMNFLAANVRNIPERHRSLRAVFDHSWKLLSPVEQTALMRLSVFRGGWGADEAESVAGATLAVLRSLTEKSLVRITSNGRYDLHELTRQYAADQLRAAGQEAETQGQHAHVFLALADRFNLQDNSVEVFSALHQMLIREQDNFRAALSWATDACEPETAVHLLRHLQFFWLLRAYWREGLKSAERLVATFPDLPPPLKMTALSILGIFLNRNGDYRRAAAVIGEATSLAEQIGDKKALASLYVDTSFQIPDYEEAKSYLERSLALRRELGSQFGTAIVLQLLGDRARIHGDFAKAEKLYTESLAILRELGDRARIAYPLGNLGRLAFEQGYYAQARAAFEESIALSRAADNKIGIADWSLRLAEVALDQEDFAQTQAALQETLTLCLETGNMPEATDALIVSAGLALATGLYERAVRLLGVAETALERYPNVLEPSSRARHEAYVAITQSHLDSRAFETAYSWGRALSLEQAIEDVLAGQ